MNNKICDVDPNISLVEQAYRELKKNILRNKYPPGYQVLEPELAEILGVSRTPVREALIRLEAEKLIELIPRRGMRVLPLVAEDILEICEVLTALEVMAVELIGKRQVGKEELQPLFDIIDNMDIILERNDLEAWVEEDEKFHSQLMELSGNKRLVDHAAVTRAQIYRARLITLKLRQKPHDVNIAYRSVCEALVAGRTEEAKNIHHSHHLAASEILAALLDRYQLPHL